MDFSASLTASKVGDSACGAEPASKPPSNCGNLSLSSRTMRDADFLPMPGILDMALTSCDATADASSEGVKHDSAARAVFGPMPLIWTSSSKRPRSSSVANPYRKTPESVTDMRHSTRARSPTGGSAATEL